MGIRSAPAHSRRQALKDGKHSVRQPMCKVLSVLILVATILDHLGLVHWRQQEKRQEYQTRRKDMSKLNSSPKPFTASSHSEIMKTTTGDASFHNASIRHSATSLVPSEPDDSGDGNPKSHIDFCLKLRGTNGYWYRDRAFSRKTFYAFGHRSSTWKKQEIQELKRIPNKQARNKLQQSLFYKGNQYNWKDTGPVAAAAQCPSIQPMSLKPFCKTLKKLQVTRIFFVGDSLMQAQVDSFFNLLSIGQRKKKKDRSYRSKDLFAKKIPNKNAKANERPNRLECPSEVYNQTIPIEFARENLGSNLLRPTIITQTEANNDERVQYGPEIPYCKENQLDGDYCPWHLRYNQTTASTTTTTTTATDSRTRTILILNQGAHFHSIESFSNTLDHFLVRFHEIAKPNDIVIFRSTVPGHYDCFNQQQQQQQIIPSVPNMTHDLFLERYATSRYDWNLFDSYNRYAAKRLEKGLLPMSIHFHYLNVYNMTVLRPDEHVSEKDCLHYTHPGPIDFWNHLLATNLKDMSITLL